MKHEDTKNTVQSYFIKISHMYYSKCFSQMSDYGIHPGQMAMLKLLYTNDGLKQSEICRELNIKPSTVAVSVKRLEKSNLVIRKPDEKDHRVSRVYLTEKTKAAGERIMKQIMENEHIMLQGFDETEICLFKRFLSHLLDNLEHMPEKEKKSSKMEREKLC